MSGPEKADSDPEDTDAPVGRIYTVKEVGDMLRVSQGTIYTDIRAGRLATLRFGRKTYRITEEALQDYLAASEVPAFSQPGTSNRRGSKSHVATTFKHLDAARLAKAWSRPSERRS